MSNNTTSTTLRTAKRPQRTETVAMTVEPRLKEAMVRAAEADNLTLSTWLRLTITEMLIQEQIITSEEAVEILLGGSSET